MKAGGVGAYHLAPRKTADERTHQILGMSVVYFDCGPSTSLLLRLVLFVLFDRSALDDPFGEFLFARLHASFEALNRADFDAIDSPSNHCWTLDVKLGVATKPLIEVDPALRIGLDRQGVGGKGAKKVHTYLAPLLSCRDPGCLLDKLFASKHFNAAIGPKG